MAAIGRRDVEAFLSWILEQRKPATNNQRFRGCQRFFYWLVVEGDLREPPMTRMKPPRVLESPVPVVTRFA